MDVVAEECNEVAIRISKVVRFGADDIEPGQEFTAMERLVNELNDLMGSLKEVVDRGYVPFEPDEAKILAKQIKVLHHLDYARSRGTVIDFNDGSLIDPQYND